MMIFFLPVAWAFQNILCGVLMLKLKDADGSCAFLHILSWNDAFEETFWASWRLFFLFVCWVLSLPRLYWLRFFFRPSCMHHWEFGSFCFLLSICRHHHSLSFQLCAAENCVQTWMMGSLEYPFCTFTQKIKTIKSFVTFRFFLKSSVFQKLVQIYF